MVIVTDDIIPTPTDDTILIVVASARRPTRPNRLSPGRYYGYKGQWIDMGTLTETDPIFNASAAASITSAGSGQVITASERALLVDFAGIGTRGLVSDPGAGSATRVLRADGTWGAVGGSLSVTAKSANYNAAAGDLVVCDCSGASFAVTLPALPSANDRVGVYLQDGSYPNIVTIDRNGNTIGGQAANVVLYVASNEADVTRGDYFEMQWDGSDWVVVIDGRIPHQCSISLSAAQSLPGGGVFTQIEFDVEDYNIGGIVDLANFEGLPRRANKYHIEAFGSFTNLSAGRTTITRITVNDTVDSSQQSEDKGAAGGTAMSTSAIFDIAALDTIQLYLYHNNGAAINTQAGALIPKMRITEIL